MRKLKRVRQAMYVQDLKHLKIKKEDLPEILSKCGAEEWAYIEHNKDETRPHLHVVLKFKNARLVNAIAKIFSDAPQYVDTWKGSINNAYSYLLHRTSDAKTSGKYQYDPSEVVASFDFQKRIKKIETEVKLSPSEVRKAIDDYSQELITRNDLQSKIGVLNFAKNKILIDKINTVLLEKRHAEFLKDFEGHRFYAIYLYGKSGVGKSRLAYEVLKSKHPHDFFIAGSARGRFENGYQGERYVLINDLRPNHDIDFQNLLMILDPYQHDKWSASRYRDVPLSLRFVVLTSVLPLEVYYQNCNSVSDVRFDTLDQLKRRVIPIEVTPDNIDDVKKAIIRIDDLQQATLKINQNKKAKHTDQDNA